jgi:glycosyltransferase EpsD
MKALIVSSVYGFLTKFERQNVEILQRMGFEVHYASNSDNVVYEDSQEELEKMHIAYHDIGIYQSPMYVKQNRKAVKELRKLIKEEHIDVVHCHTPTGGMVTRRACKGLDVYVIYTAHGFHFYEGGGWLHNLIFRTAEDWMSRNTDTIVTINRYDEAAAREMHARNVYRMPGVGVDRERFVLTTPEMRKQARERLGIPEDAFYMISVGELRENKNQMTVLKTLAAIASQGTALEHMIYGIIGSGRQRAEMEQFIEEHNIKNYVRFYGYQEDVRTYLQAADVLIFPSIREGLGMAALEALTTGLPVIATANRGSKEYIKSGVNGYFVPNFDIEVYERAMRAIYEDRSWHTQERRAEIRESVAAFRKEATANVMRKVYNDAKNQCHSFGLQSRAKADEAGGNVCSEPDIFRL